MSELNMHMRGFEKKIPDKCVLTALIKAHIPARISFSVQSSVDSRRILGCKGAEPLLGNGDMLFVSRLGTKPLRLQAASLSKQELNGIIDWVPSR